MQRKDLTTERVYDAIMRVLTEEGFRAAAQKVSKRIRSRKRTPLQEAAGELPIVSKALPKSIHETFQKYLLTPLCFAHTGNKAKQMTLATSALHLSCRSREQPLMDTGLA